MASHQEEASVQLVREEKELHHGDWMITSPLLRPSTSCSSPEYGEEEEENSPVEQVALTVPGTPALTFRMWVLGTASCNQFFWYRKEPLTITAISAQIAVVPLGRLMAAALPECPFFGGRRWEFTLNPGPFNVKEHVLITIFANSGAGTVYAIHLITGVRVFYGKPLSFISILVVLTTQMAGVRLGWNIPTVSA